MDTESSDEELAARYCKQRDEKAFNEIVRRYREPVFRLAVSVLGPNFVPVAFRARQHIRCAVRTNFSRVLPALTGALPVYRPYSKMACALSVLSRG